MHVIESAFNQWHAPIFTSKDALYIVLAGLCGTCISLGVSGVTDTLMPK